MTQRTVKSELVKNLTDWTARWPKATNLGFDPETREPTIYSATKERTKISSIPWKREADTLTVLSQPTRFPAPAVAAATSRYGKIRDQQTQLRVAGEESLRIAEGNLLDAWRIYYAEPVATRAPLRRDILSAEATLQELEKSLAPKNRRLITRVDKDEPNVLLELKSGIYVPPMPAARRGISLVGGPSESSSEPPAAEAKESL